MDNRDNLIISNINQMNKQNRNESAETVPRQSQQITFLIYYQEQQVLRINMKNNDTVGDLIDAVKIRLANRFENIVGLSSEKLYTLDYALTVRQNKLLNIRNNQRLFLLLEEVVANLAFPSLSDFTFLSLIGEGISSAVYLVRHCSNGRLYALKQIKKKYFCEFKTMESVLRQRKILCEYVQDLPFATRLQAAFESYLHLNFLLEFYPGGEFFYHLTQIKLNQRQAKVCFSQILLTMEQLHKKKILYRDLKPQNIMVDFDGHLHLGDFGLCKMNLEKEEVAHSHCGSAEYMAYETREAQGYSYAADFYTMGAIIYEMVKSVPPFYQTEEPPSFSETSQAFRDIVLHLIEREPSRRLTSFVQMKKCSWLREIDWDKVARKEYKMATKLDLYKNYIHEQFASKYINNQDLQYQQKYDGLYQESFLYLNYQKNGIGHYYPQSKKGSKIKSKKSNISRDNDGKSNRSKSKTSKNSSKSKDSKFKREDNPFKRKNIKQPNLYTSPQILPNRQTKQKYDLHNKSLSKGKNVLPSINFNKSPQKLKFNKITTVKSTGTLKATQYIRELTSRDESKRKKLT